MRSIAWILISGLGWIGAVLAATSEAVVGGKTVVLQEIVRGLKRPVSITHAGDARLFVTQQEGQVVIIDRGRILPEPFLDIKPLVSCCGERGFLSVAFHPSYAANGYFFVNYTDVPGHTVVARYRVSAADPNRADPSSAEVVLRIQQPFSNHNGGQLQFGPDGYLYIGTGDGGSAGDPQNRAQNGLELLGKMLRIDVDGARPYGIPPDNPFIALSSVRPEIWATGLRNPWRFSFDRETGDLFIADVGQNRWEEINFQPASSRGGENYGWRLMEGSHCYNPSTGCNDGARVLQLPILEYSHDEGCSVSGGYRYRGSGVPVLRGSYVYGDFCSGTIWKATQEGGGAWQSSVLFRSGKSITAFGEDVAGEIWVADYAGSLLKIVSGRARPVRR